MNMRASAARYAKALLDVTIRETDPEQAERELAGFVELLHQHAALHAVLVNPAIPARGKHGVVAQVIDRQQPSVPVGKLLLLLADRDKLAILPDLLLVFRERLREHQQVVRAEVTTATPLPEARAEQLRERLAQTTGRRVTMTTKVDPSIIGGMVTRIGSTVYDGSVVTQLQAIKRHLAR
jgi:F-type H+-transporting ATPase subunit delta